MSADLSAGCVRVETCLNIFQVFFLLKVAQKVNEHSFKCSYKNKKLLWLCWDDYPDSVFIS